MFKMILDKLPKLNIKLRVLYPIMFGAGCLIIFITSAATPNLSLSATVTMLAALGGFTGFLYNKNSQEINIFRNLFKEFNERYDALNDDLTGIYNDHGGDTKKNKICKKQCKEFSTEEAKILNKYFNLCAEEYMYYEAGLIDKQVWDSWKNGMKYYSDNTCIKNEWVKELKNNSYYGFDLSHLESDKINSQTKKS